MQLAINTGLHPFHQFEAVVTCAQNERVLESVPPSSSPFQSTIRLRLTSTTTKAGAPPLTTSRVTTNTGQQLPGGPGRAVGGGTSRANRGSAAAVAPAVGVVVSCCAARRP